MGKVDEYNRAVLESIKTGQPVSAKLVKRVYQSSLSESQIQQECVKWFRFAYPDLYADGVFYHVGNERQCSIRQGQRLKAEGVLKGVADLHLDVARHGYHKLCIEMKKPGGYQSPEQKAWQKGVEKHGIKYVVCKSLDEFISIITQYLNEDESDTTDR